MDQRELKTTCLQCGKEFPINMSNAWGAFERYSHTDLMVVIVCPHCKKRYEL
jgi:DNA-directed RNA polymerase subunit RPC12/RpoP